MYAYQGPQAYARISLESRVAGATPHQLIAMLFEGACGAIAHARIAFAQGNVARRGEMISKAINIVDNGLRAALDHQKGPAIAADLERLYDYISRLLMQANLHSSPDKLAQAETLLRDLAEVWQAIAPHKQAGQP